jgi:hypothetical protein
MLIGLTALQFACAEDPRQVVRCPPMPPNTKTPSVYKMNPNAAYDIVYSFQERETNQKEPTMGYTSTERNRSLDVQPELIKLS